MLITTFYSVVENYFWHTFMADEKNVFHALKSDQVKKKHENIGKTEPGSMKKKTHYEATSRIHTLNSIALCATLLNVIKNVMPS